MTEKWIKIFESIAKVFDFTVHITFRDGRIVKIDVDPVVEK